MNIEGTYTLQAPPEDVWQCLMNHEMLLRTVPGVERIEQAGEDSYQVWLRIKYAPLMGTYHGRVAIAEQRYPCSYRLIVEGEARQSKISASGSIDLNAHDGNTVIAYKWTLTTGRLGTLLPPRVVKGAAKLFIQQYFSALADQLRRSRRVEARMQEGQAISVIQQRGGDIVILPSATAAPPDPAISIAHRISHNITHAIVALLKPGNADPEEQALWAQRVRRIGVVAILLMLVWIGTRLPRKR
jgi:carbon monoxide dehydrogenase subunit G